MEALKSLLTARLTQLVLRVLMPVFVTVGYTEYQSNETVSAIVSLAVALAMYWLDTLIHKIRDRASKPTEAGK